MFLLILPIMELASHHPTVSLLLQFRLFCSFLKLPLQLQSASLPNSSSLQQTLLAAVPACSRVPRVLNLGDLFASRTIVNDGDEVN